MADLVRKYERIATEPAPPTPIKSTSKRTMSLVVPEESPRLPSSPPAPAGGRVAGERLPRFRYDQRCSALESRESSNKRKRFLGAEAKNLKIETEDETCTDGNLRRETPASLDAGRRPEVHPPPQPSPAADDDAAKVKSACTAEIEAYLSAMEREQQRRFAEKYNYDVVNDTPLQGRYEWIPLNVGAAKETLK